MCNAPGQCGSPIAEEQVPSEALPTNGGPIAAGTYVLSALTIYTGPGGASGPVAGSPVAAETLVLANGTFAVSVVFTANMQTMDFYEAGTYSTVGTTVTFDETCPMSAAGMPSDYSATPSQIRFVAMLNGQSNESVYDKIN
jgi:hypothetical protein